MKKKILVFFLISIIYIIFFPLFLNNVIYHQMEVEITSGYGKNEKAEGTEVWIDQIIIDGEPISLDTIPLNGDWTYTGRIFSGGKEKSMLKIFIRYKKSISINFIKHPYSGMVRVRTTHKDNVLDLYDENQSIQEYVCE